MDQDQHQFDHLTLRIGTAPTRRQAVVGFLAGAAAHFARPEADVAARCVKLGKRCRRDDRCCGGGRCRRRRCRCKPGLQNCNGRCVNLANDPLHCGACGNRCLNPAAGCRHGTCGCDAATDCPAGCQCNAFQGQPGDADFVCTEPGSPCDGPQCTSDSDCPLGSVCQLACETIPPFGIATCTVPCVAG